MLQQYLEKYANDEVNLVADLPGHYRQALLIPAFNEASDFIDSLYKRCSTDTATLFIIIINQADDGSQCCPQNEKLTEHILASGIKQWQQQHLNLIQWPEGCAVLLVDRFKFGPRIPSKKGVGLARKIGADIAVALIAAKQLSSNWIYNSDADAKLPCDYFCLDQQAPKRAAAATFGFHHQAVYRSCPAQVLEANALYQQALNYYVDGLAWAGSAYAFHTIGSTLAFTAKAYSQARGFPTRAAGEDFYLLNKLAKLGQVFSPDTQPLLLQARTSDRVPFGTGPAVSRIIDLENNNEDYCYYHPQLFVELKQCLQASLTLTVEDQTQFWQSLTGHQQQALIELGIDKFFNHIRKQCKTQEQLAHHWHHWFDAFKTLKFMHALRQQQHPDIPLSEAVIKFQQLRML